jgi:hypothetical protein
MSDNMGFRGDSIDCRGGDMGSRGDSVGSRGGNLGSRGDPNCTNLGLRRCQCAK